MPENAGEDSFSLLPIFQKKETNYLRKTTVHHSSEGYFSIRKGKWKLVLGPGSGGWSWPTPGKEEQGLPIVQLYDLEKDVSETKNLQQDNPAVVKELKKILIEHIKNGRSTKGSLQKNDGEFQKDRMIWLEN